ncbi:MAG: hypothetical protein O2816_05025 [Planctomycetota bacterium]|nr:hypothetical protein [Planctomycetota bacterium]
MLTRKTTETQTVVNSTTLVDDDALFQAMLANEVWACEWNLYMATAGNADVKVAVTVPSAATLLVMAEATRLELGEQDEGISTASGGAISLITGGTATLVEYRLVKVRAMIVNGENAGNAQLQWAQNTARSWPPTLVKTNSYLVAFIQS